MKANLDVYIELLVKNERKTESYKRIKSRSLTYNFLKFLRDVMLTKTTTIGGSYGSYYTSTSDIVLATVRDTTNTSVNATTGRVLTTTGSIQISILGLDAPAGNHNYGVVVGKGTATPTPNDFNLQSRFTHGDGLDQLQYGATSIEDVTVSSNTSQFRIIRSFTNNYSGSQTINEVGLIARYYDVHYISGSYRAVERLFLIARDVLSSPVTLQQGKTLTVRYIFVVTT